MIFEFTEAFIDAVDEVLGDKCLMSSCDRDSVSGREFHYCSKHFFAAQMIDRRIEIE